MALLSVLITTYNLENYIDETLESVMNQETNYDFEVLVGDDGSSDNTVKVVEEWEKRYPGKIRHYIMDRNPNQEYNPIFRASRNRVNLLEHAHGDYLIFLDGDDFFIDKKKFQKQLDFLENPENRKYVMCGHNMYYYYEDIQQRKPMISKSLRTGYINKKRFWKYHYLPAEAFIYRNVFQNGLPEKILREYFDDNIIVFSFLEYGDIYYMSDYMACYRQNSTPFKEAGKLKQNLISLVDLDVEMKINSAMKKYSYIRHYPNLRYVVDNKNNWDDKYMKEIEEQLKNIGVGEVKKRLEHTSKIKLRIISLARKLDFKIGLLFSR